MTPTHRFVVPEEREGDRLDRCLADMGSEWTRSRVRRFIDDNRVLHNGHSAKPAARVEQGDVIEVSVPEVQPSEVAPEEMPLNILFEDEHLLVLDKPTNLVIHPAVGNPSGTLVNALLHYCKDLSGIGGVERPGIVHRLDKDTTGVIVVAKNDTAHLGLSLAFRRRQIDKNYIAICYGVPEARQGSIDTPIGRHPKERQRMAVSESGRNARTNYEVEEAFAGATQLRCHPVTGRTHQIRVHFAHIGHALIGDPLYAGRQWRNFEDPSIQAYSRSFPRQALHAASIAFRHPVTEKEIRVAAELPKDIKHLCDVLRGKVTNPR